MVFLRRPCLPRIWSFRPELLAMLLSNISIVNIVAIVISSTIIMKIFPVKVDTLDKNYNVFSRVVRGITHDYNNLLTPILAYPEIIKMDVKEDTQGVTLLSAIESTAQELLIINRQLMFIISSGAGQKIDTDVYDLMDSLSRSLDGMDGFEGITLEIKCKKGLVVKCQYDEIIVALQKLVQNAWDAMAMQGSVKIIVEKVKIHPQKGQSKSGAEDKAYICISVVDSGVGIEERHMDSIFEPFFTTKKTPAKRTVGLGLTQAYRSIINSDGLVGVESTAGQGTTVSVFLPAV